MENTDPQHVYADRNNLFEIRYDDGWHLKVANDIRSKIRLELKENKNVSIGVISYHSDFKSFEEVLENANFRLNHDLKKVPYSRAEMQVTSFNEHSAVKMEMELHGMRSTIFLFLLGSGYHNVAFHAPSASYEKYHDRAAKVLRNYSALYFLSNDENLAFENLVAAKKRKSEVFAKLRFTGVSEIAIDEAEQMGADPTITNYLKNFVRKIRGESVGNKDAAGKSGS